MLTPFLSKNKAKLFWKNFIKFFLPLYPINPFKTTYYLIVLGVMLAIQLVLRKLIIPIPIFRTQISFIWLPVMLVGWFFGPIYGFIFGWITDTLGFLLGGGVWFWMYAIQEPLIGLFAGLIAGLSQLLINKKQIYIHFFIQQLLLILFTVYAFVYLFFWFYGRSNEFQISWFSKTLFYVVIVFLILYFILIETIIFWMIWKKSTRIITYLYASIIVSSMIFLWSFLLGPEIAIKYFGYINNGRVPDKIQEYGPIFYLIPRIIRETIKTPIQTLILTGLIVGLNPVFVRIKNQIANSYAYEHFKLMK